MLKALIEIGKLLEGEYPEALALVSDPYPNFDEKRGKFPKVLCIDLKSEGKALTVSDTSIEEYDRSNVYKRYFFIEPPASKGRASSLSFKLPGKETAILERLKILAELGYEVDNALYSEIVKCIKFLRKEAGKTKQFLVVLKVDGKYPAEREDIRKKLTSLFFSVLDPHQEGRCHMCGFYGKVYSGLNRIFRFYTVDKPGYAPEVNENYAWKQCSLCEKCVLNLLRGKRALEDFLTHSFYGKNFWIIPVSTEKGALEGVINRFRNFKGEVYERGYPGLLEDRILKEAGEEGGTVYYHFVFPKEENQALRILLHIEEVLPSRLKKYILLKEELVTDFSVNLNLETNFSFFYSPYLRKRSDLPGFSDEDFLKLVDKVFRKSVVDERWLLARTMDRVSVEFLRGNGFPFRAIVEAFFSLVFLKRWGVLKRKDFSGGEMMREDIPYAEFFNRYADFFNHPAKRGLVLLGALVQKFLVTQRLERGSTPFRKQLKNLRLSQKDVKNLWVALQNKMNEYDVGHYWKNLREAIALSFISAGDDWGLSPDEIGFYLVVGMAIHNRFDGGGEDGNTQE
ncbi:MAG: TIGR02556 family CRISPR-associated protein [Synergistetes bacterium]|nr:TIGR02556 family CRISPR-associated protein [Synergistota bacterium]